MIHHIGKLMLYLYHAFNWILFLVLIKFIGDWALAVFFIYLFIFIKNFNLWRSLLMIFFYYQTKTLINFWGRWGLNSRFLIQSLETLLVELTRTHELLTSCLPSYQQGSLQLLLSTTVECTHKKHASPFATIRVKWLCFWPLSVKVIENDHKKYLVNFEVCWNTFFIVSKKETLSLR